MEKKKNNKYVLHNKRFILNIPRPGCFVCRISEAAAAAASGRPSHPLGRLTNMSNTRVYVIVLLPLGLGPCPFPSSRCIVRPSSTSSHSTLCVHISLGNVLLLGDGDRGIHDSPAKTTWNRHGFCCMPTSLTPQQERVPKSWSVTGVYRNTSIIDPFLWWRSLSMSKFSPELLNFHRKLLQMARNCFISRPLICVCCAAAPCQECNSK